MFCPKCSNVSRLVLKQEGRYDCASCGGTFVDSGIIKKVIPWFSLDSTSKKTSIFACPNDHEFMVAQKISGIELESCPKCGGVWFDKNEIKELRKRERADFSLPKEMFRNVNITEDDESEGILMSIISLISGFWI